MAKRKPKRKSFWSPPAVVGRVVWGRGGFKGAVRKVRREWIGPQQVARISVDPGTGTLKKAGVRQKTDGIWEVKTPRPRKKVTAKQRIAEKNARNADGLNRHANAAAAVPQPMAQRVQRKTDGTFNGSTPATPEQRADTAFARAERAAARAEKHANQLLRRGL
jgi:hypothetical protein